MPQLLRVGAMRMASPSCSSKAGRWPVGGRRFGRARCLLGRDHRCSPPTPAICSPRLGMVDTPADLEADDSALVEAVWAELRQLGHPSRVHLSPPPKRSPQRPLGQRSRGPRPLCRRRDHADGRRQLRRHRKRGRSPGRVLRRPRTRVCDADRAMLLQIAAAARRSEPGEFSGKIAVVTGMTPESIGGAVVGRLLAGGATVIATASRVNRASPGR